MRFLQEAERLEEQICWLGFCIKEQELSEDKKSVPEVIKNFSCSTQLSMEFFLLINVKMPTIVGILTFMNMKNSIISLSEPKKMLNFQCFLNLRTFKISCSTELSMKKSFITSGLGLMGA